MHGQSYFDWQEGESLVPPPGVAKPLSGYSTQTSPGGWAPVPTTFTPTMGYSTAWGAYPAPFQPSPFSSGQYMPQQQDQGFAAAFVSPLSYTYPSLNMYSTGIPAYAPVTSAPYLSSAGVLPTPPGFSLQQQTDLSALSLESLSLNVAAYEQQFQHSYAFMSSPIDSSGLEDGDADSNDIDHSSTLNVVGVDVDELSDSILASPVLPSLQEEILRTSTEALPLSTVTDNSISPRTAVTSSPPVSSAVVTNEAKGAVDPPKSKNSRASPALETSPIKKATASGGPRAAETKAAPKGRSTVTETKVAPPTAKTPSTSTKPPPTVVAAPQTATPDKGSSTPPPEASPTNSNGSAEPKKFSWADVARTSPAPTPTPTPTTTPVAVKAAPKPQQGTPGAQAHQRKPPAQPQQPKAASAPAQAGKDKEEEEGGARKPRSLRSRRGGPIPKLDCLNDLTKDLLSAIKAAKFFVIKSYSEDDIHKSIKYSIWASTDTGNKRLDRAYRDFHAKGPIYLFFSVNGSGQFCGIAEMVSPLDFNQSSSCWNEDKWNGQFSVKWRMIKDVPNSQLRHIRLTNNENKPVTNSRDTQEVLYNPGYEFVKIFQGFPLKTSILDDFEYYNECEEEDKRKKAEMAAEAEALAEGSEQAQ